MKNFISKQLLLLVVGIVFVVAGVFSVDVATKADSDYKNLERNGVQTSATLTDVKYSESRSSKKNRTKTYETITLTYQDHKGGKNTMTDRNQLQGARAIVGAKKIVFYDRDNPSHAVIKGDNDSGTGKLLGSIFIVVGAGLVVTFTISTIKRQRQSSIGA